MDYHHINFNGEAYELQGSNWIYIEGVALGNFRQVGMMMSCVVYFTFLDPYTGSR